MAKGKILWRLFIEYFRIALFVVGGGYAILIVADEVFSKKLKWLREGELLEHLPVFQMIPGLIAGNTAVYVGLKMAGRLGAAVAILAVALPSIIIFTLVAAGFNFIPLGNAWIESAFLGLRSSLAGVVLGTILKGWKNSVRGLYGYVAVAVASLCLVCFHVNTVVVLGAAMVVGIILEYLGYGTEMNNGESQGFRLEPISKYRRIGFYGAFVLFVALITLVYGQFFWIFIKFGLLCFGGGFVLIPLYIEEFVGDGAAFLQLSEADFTNLMALTQMTPGPVSINSATFFGYRMFGLLGAIISSIGLLIPSYFLLTWALTSLDKWKTNRFVKGLLNGVRPATVSLMVSSFIVFGRISIWKYVDGMKYPEISVIALLLALFSTYVIKTKRLSVMASIFICAFAGVLVTFVKGLING